MAESTRNSQVSRNRRLNFLNGLSEEACRLYYRIPEEVGCTYHDLFASPGAEDQLFGPGARKVELPSWTHFPEVIEDVPLGRVKRTTLSGDDEVRLFLQYNYARFRLGKLAEAQKRRKSPARARQMLLWFKRLMKGRSALVRANLALVLAMAKRTRIPNVEFGEMVCEGNMALLRSIEKFDVSRGFKFSTYACRAILKSFHRLATKTGRYRKHFPTEFIPEMERSDYDVHKHEMQRQDSVEAVQEILATNRAALSDVERKIVTERFAIISRGRGRTLSEVGKMVGLTNERVRQIQKGALRKIRDVMNEEYLVA